MSTSRTTTQTTTAVGSIPITGGTGNPPSGLTRPSTPDSSDEERQLELQLERARERKRQAKEKKKAEEEAKRRAEEEAARRAAEEEEKRREETARATNARQVEEEAAEKRRRIAAAAVAQSRRGPSPGEATTSARRVEVEIPRVVKGKASQRKETSGGDLDDGDDSKNDDEEDKERAPCERCYNKKITCLEQVKCSYSGRPVQARREGGPSGERMAVMESQMAQLLANNWALREATSSSHQYLRQLLRQQDEDHARLIAIETRNAIEEEEDEEKEAEKIVEGEKDGEGEMEEVEMGGEGEEEGNKPAPKKARSEKGKEREE
ncbi:hypothetical protein EV359DRAFT_88063 [Lentinula novae-zelandiae]|nr:hypothetical protein EV359DRAFT_88063 [Lentinula novae-zelandiae]